MKTARNLVKSRSVLSEIPPHRGLKNEKRFSGQRVVELIHRAFSKKPKPFPFSNRVYNGMPLSLPTLLRYCKRATV